MIKVIDFGFAAFCQDNQKLKIFCGTPSYMAPELVRKNEYDGRQVDMWALGILLFALLAGTFPFRG
jgi:MAP/microtubule affinity-regulating kinase